MTQPPGATRPIADTAGTKAAPNGPVARPILISAGGGSPALIAARLVGGSIGLARQVQMGEGAVHMRHHDLAGGTDVGFVEFMVAGHAEQ
jgi:hypothetical protein